MAAVKGTKQPKMVVVPYRPGRRWAMVFSFLAFGVLTGVASYLWGTYQTAQTLQGVMTERDTLHAQGEALQAELNSVRQETVNLRLGSEIDRKASEDVRGEVTSLKERIAELEADISFYRGLMEPTDNKKGLVIGQVNVISTGKPRTYKYKVVLQQLTTNHRLLSGQLQVSVVGRESESGVIKRIALKELSQQVEAENIRLRFKYFQNVEGELVIPTGFEPERLELIAKSTGKKGQVVEKKFGWLVQES
ncbi:DUF6776 family protein [Marinibactrum halimedae]|uniref:Uncharacterized protein n=1 Tax=Marinibactrum halimedae TaxID=1444977 RepID=A0AA37WP93_9GAMM|nr:DUF6776 family protein [Marinibactrum halimedae]MCD9460491.1 hypothetical protein [Marinibactrum halimedae]GLS25897.1 hypothetical protein GCM10007877_16110 [Marinibactrum halimedae]